jgi:MFS superfamily sulfate permease-like transporter
MTIENKRLTGILTGVVLLLLLPLIAMQFTAEVNWTPFDFVVAGVLLLGTGLLVEGVLRKVPKREHRILLCAALLSALFLIWVELAVGIFGTPLAGS